MTHSFFYFLLLPFEDFILFFVKAVVKNFVKCRKIITFAPPLRIREGLQPPCKRLTNAHVNICQTNNKN